MSKPVYDLARFRRLGTQGWTGQSGIEEAQGNSYLAAPGAQEMLAPPGDPGMNLPSFVNPYRTVMYSVVGISTTIPLRALIGNYRRTYLLVQNLGPGNLFLGIGTDPAADGSNVLNLVTTQLYEQIGGGSLLPDGTSFANSFVSSEYISLLTDIANTRAMILEGTYSPPRIGARY